MFLFHAHSFFFIVFLVLNIFNIEFAHKILMKLVESPISYWGIVIPISLVVSYFSLVANAVSNLDETLEDDINTEEDNSVSLSNEQKEKVNEAVSYAQEGDKNKEKLDNIIGLDNVKKQIADLKHFVIAQKKRKIAGLPTQNINLHLVFTGNPGTGKTTIAREVAKIYKSYGLIKKGQLIETDRSGLVSEYVGQTAIKTKEIIAKAMGGVLFIDEAYALEGDNFGQEAIDTLLKEMEDKKGKFAVIVAGYPEEMNTFVDSNPGLKSRFGLTLNFDDYSHSELLQIFELFCLKEGFKLSDRARVLLTKHVVSSAPLGERGFGNGRYIRNVFESVLLKQSERVSSKNINDVDKLQEITEWDIEEIIKA